MNVYFVRAGNKKGAIKIGVADDVDKRLSELQTGNPFELSIIAVINCDSREHAYHTEGRLHRLFKRCHIRGEWFKGTIDLSRINERMHPHKDEKREKVEAKGQEGGLMKRIKARQLSKGKS